MDHGARTRRDIKPAFEKILSYSSRNVESFEAYDLVVAENLMIAEHLDFNDAVNVAIMERFGVLEVCKKDERHLGRIGSILTGRFITCASDVLLISAVSLFYCGDVLGRLRRWKERYNGWRGVYVSPLGDSFYPEELLTPPESLAPYVPTPPDVVEQLLMLAELKPGEVVYDLGSGDGRIIHTAAGLFKARGVGVEIHGNLVEEATRVANELGVSGSAQFIRGNLLDVDLGEADVVTVYLLTASNERIREKLERELRVGARVVTHDFPMSRWVPSVKVSFVGESGKHMLYLYRMGTRLQ